MGSAFQMPCFSNGFLILEKVNPLPILHPHLPNLQASFPAWTFPPTLPPHFLFSLCSTICLSLPHITLLPCLHSPCDTNHLLRITMILVWGSTWHLSIWVCVIWLQIFFPNSIHFPASSFFFTAKYYPAMSVQTLIFHHLLPFPGPWIGQNEQAVIPVVGHRVLWVCAQSGMFLGPLQTDFQNGCSSYLSHRQCTKVPHFPNSAPALVLGVHDNCFC